MSLKLTRKLLVRLGISTLFLILLIAIVFNSIQKFNKNYSEVERTYVIINNIETLKINLERVQGALRGYMLTEEKLFKEDIFLTLKKVNDDIYDIESHISDEAISSKFFSFKEKTLNAQAYFTENLTEQQENKRTQNDNLVFLRKTQNLTKELFLLLDKVKEAEYLLLESKKIESRETIKKTIILLALIGFSCLFIGGLSIITFRQDIKRRKEIEDELREINHNKNKFFTIISHDLRGPIKGIIALTEVMKNTSGVSREYIEDISNHLDISAKNLLKLTEDLLTWSKIQMEKIDFEPVLISLKELTLEAINPLTNLAKEKDIIICNLITEPIFVRGDRNMVLTVMRNLINNAIKFTPKQGMIIIDANLKNKFYHISIKDNGVGINPEGIKKLFKTGQNYTSQGTNGELGTGLGLLICKDFVKKNKGDIWVESKKGEGSVFSFSVPAAS